MPSEPETLGAKAYELAAVAADRSRRGPAARLAVRLGAVRFGSAAGAAALLADRPGRSDVEPS